MRNTRPQQRSRKQTQSEGGGFRWLLALILIILFIILIVFLKKQSVQLAAEQTNTTLNKVTHPAKNHLLNNAKTAAPSAPQSPAPPQPHFDFYTTLPQANTSNPNPAPAPAPVSSQATTQKIVASESAITKGNSITPLPKTKASGPQSTTPLLPLTPTTASSPTKSASKTAFSSSENNENSVAAQTEKFIEDQISQLNSSDKTAFTAGKTTHYVVQLGLFKSFTDADTFKAKMSLLGLEVKTKSVKRGTTKLYRVFIGPFDSASDAKRQQQELTKQSIKSSLVKITD